LAAIRELPALGLNPKYQGESASSVLKLEEVNMVDVAGLWKAYEQWPDVSTRALQQRLILPEVHSPQAIVLGGMGGSGAACDVVADWLNTNSKIPSFVVKDYHLPRSAGKRSLVFIISLSGETKEALSLLDEAVDRGCDVAAFSSGGAIERTCKKRGIAYNRVEKVMVPRASLPGMVFVPLRVLNDLGFVDALKELHEAEHSLRKLVSRVTPDIPFKSNEAKKLASTLAGKSPVIYTSSRHASVGHHFKASMNENAKVPVDAGCYPEIFHNEIETWGSSAERAVVILRHAEEDKRISRKIVRAKWILSRAGVPVTEVYEGGGMLSSLLDWCLYMDMVSVYVAVLKKTPPISTPLLDSARLI